MQRGPGGLSQPQPAPKLRALWLLPVGAALTGLVAYARALGRAAVLEGAPEQVRETLVAYAPLWALGAGLYHLFLGGLCVWTALGLLRGELAGAREGRAVWLICAAAALAGSLVALWPSP